MKNVIKELSQESLKSTSNTYEGKEYMRGLNYDSGVSTGEVMDLMSDF